MNPELEKAIAAIRAQGGDEAAVQRYLASVGAVEVDPSMAALRDASALGDRAERGRAREATSAAERALTPAQRVGAGVQNALGMASFGVSNLAGDAIDALFTDRTFAANRQARKMTNAASPTVDRVVSTVGGALLNPVGALVKAPAGAGLITRGAAFAADNALQGGATSAIQNLDEFSPEGFKRAGEAGLMGAATGVGAAAATRAAVSGIRGATTFKDVYNAPRLDVTRHGMQDALKAMDDLNFGQVRREAAGAPPSAAIARVLQSQTVKPFADIVRRSEEFRTAPNETILLEAYKRMSEAQRKAANAQEGNAELLASIAQTNRDIGLAKGRMLTAADPSMPSLRPANAAHATARGEIEAFEATADAIQRIIGRKSDKGKKLLFDSPEALRRGIAKMTPGEARAAYQAVLGRTKEVVKLSSNPLTGFGVPGAIMRTSGAPSQVNPYLRLLEERAGITPRLFDRPAVAERAVRTGARSAAGLLDY